MNARRSIGCVGLGLLAALSCAASYGGEEAETGELRARVAQLEAQAEKLRAELAAAERARRSVELHLLRYLASELGGEPADSYKWRDARGLAVRLAPSERGNYLVWEVLLKTGVLKDGMSLADAEKLVGPPTETSETQVDWYFNPGHRLHVAPFLRAKVTDEGLTDWQSGRR